MQPEMANSNKHLADEMSSQTSVSNLYASSETAQVYSIPDASVTESVAFMDLTLKMMPIRQLSMKKLAVVGQGGKLWRWKRSHHQWLLQFKWKRQKPWKLSEWIRHNDERLS